MNWINATERKPDTTRKVFVRGIIVARHSRGEEEWLAVASWHEFDKRWSNINTIRPDDTARTAEPSHWAEITDILTSLDTAEPEDKAEIDVPEYREHEVWIEGYSATGEHCPARFLGRYKTTSFEVAVLLAMDAHKFSPDLYDPERMTHWGCRFFDNEADARKGYG